MRSSHRNAVRRSRALPAVDVNPVPRSPQPLFRLPPDQGLQRGNAFLCQFLNVPLLVAGRNMSNRGATDNFKPELVSGNAPRHLRDNRNSRFQMQKRRRLVNFRRMPEERTFDSLSRSRVLVDQNRQILLLRDGTQRWTQSQPLSTAVCIAPVRF